MSFNVEYLFQGTTLWQRASSGHGSEQQAIFNAKSVAQRPRYERVRVVNRNGAVVWIS